MSAKGSAEQYRAAGVDLPSAERTKDRIARAVGTTRTRASLGTIGAFGGMIRLPAGLADPVLVLSTDGVGTKVLVAHMAGRYDTVGEDLVNHCVNDILVHGARPLAFLDYLAGSGLPEDATVAVVEGVARACQRHAMPLAGGETAQMPDLYRPGHFDLAGTIVGVVEAEQAIHGDRIQPGEVLLGYASGGLHTNGYTLARRIMFRDMKLDLDSRLDQTGQTVAESLLAVHRSYYDAVSPSIDRVHGLAHITGGGIAGNLIRLLPEGCRAIVDPGTWDIPPLFQFLQDGGRVSTDEMRAVFNLGVGLVAVLPVNEVDTAQAAARRAEIDTWVMGEVRAGERAVDYAD